MESTSFQEYVTYKNLIDIKNKLYDFAKSIHTEVSVSENENEIIISNGHLSIYIIADKEKGADVLQIPLMAFSCFKVVILFHDKLLYNKEIRNLIKIKDFLISFSVDEINEILKSMPLITSFVDDLKSYQLNDFAIIWRDHFLEENIPLLKAFEKLGVAPEWIFPISKGDQTIKLDRIAAYFSECGYYDVSVLQNPLNSPNETEGIAVTLSKINQFTVNAKKNGKTIMVIDDGGIIADYFFDNQNNFDCAIEVTVVGIRKLKKLKNIHIPIYDLGLSELKEIITYPEIAESCVKRIRELIPAEKIIGRRILILGYGMSGKHVANIFKNMGANVCVVDNDILKLISAGEKGFATYKTAIQAIKEFVPFLIVGCTGDISLKYDDYLSVNNGTYITGIATKDLEELRIFRNNFESQYIPNTGFIHKLGLGKYFIQLGDGRSINLYKSEAIPNRANDIFKTGILFASYELAYSYKNLKGGIYLQRVNDILKKSTIYEQYYKMYFERHD